MTAARPGTLFCILLAVNSLARPYAGITHDARLYSAQVLNRINPGVFAGPDKPEQQWTLLQNILVRDHDSTRADFNPKLYIRGVVNQEIAGLTTEDPGRKSKHAAQVSVPHWQATTEFRNDA